MIIPIFIPRYFDDDSNSNKHGNGCKCPDCLKNELWDKMPREYYKYRYAVPLQFIIKNLIYRIIGWVCILIGLIIFSSPLIFREYFITHQYPLIIPFVMIIGIIMVISSTQIFDKFVKYDFHCKDKIYLEIKDSYSNPEKWEDKVKISEIPKNYRLTKVESSWRYKNN